MQNDKITLKDLSFFASDGGGVFALLDHTTTHAGKEVLRKHIMQPPNTPDKLQQTQDAVKFWLEHGKYWPEIISNGTLLMLEKFFDAADYFSAPPSGITMMFSNLMLKLFNKNEYFFTQFSLSHLSDFLNGCKQLMKVLEVQDIPPMLRSHLEEMQKELQHRLTEQIAAVNKQTPFKDLSKLSFSARREMKHTIQRLVQLYAKLDSWQAMAKAAHTNKWTFPTLLAETPIVYEAKDLYHPLLAEPVSYDVSFGNGKNFLVLTGANMSGKTTFMRAMGVGALLAHLGTGVPAANMRISFLQGIITNMHVEDDLLKGESYFFAEVQRMKQTAQRIIREGAHLVLMDELFKGTNVHDAYECTRAVIDGLLLQTGHIMVLSTHLYEVAQHFKDNPSLQFAYFVTNTTDDGNFKFRYQLKEGISNDRIGYKILQREGVIDLLQGKAGQ
jgi:DNA mismatch repair ATPase MutS